MPAALPTEGSVEADTDYFILNKAHFLKRTHCLIISFKFPGINEFDLQHVSKKRMSILFIIILELLDENRL